MNDLAKVSRNGRQQVVALPEAFEVKASELRVRREGRNLVLEPVDEDMGSVDRLEALDETAAGGPLDRSGPDSAERIPPGHYTADTLPPLGPGAAAILASVDEVAPLHAGKTDAAAPAGTDEGEGIAIDDAAAATVAPSDRGLPGLSPDR